MNLKKTQVLPILLQAPSGVKCIKMSTGLFITINRHCGPPHLSELNTALSSLPKRCVVLCVKVTPKINVYSQGFLFVDELNMRSLLFYRFLLVGATYECKT